MKPAPTPKTVQARDAPRSGAQQKPPRAEQARKQPDTGGSDPQGGREAPSGTRDAPKPAPAAELNQLRQSYRERQIGTDLLRRVLVAFVADEVHKVGLERAVLGLSGGVDSSLVAYLAAEALGPGNVWGILMPYRTSSPQSAADAELVVRETGIHFRHVDISLQIDAYFEAFPDASPLRRGNKMARERMTILYDQSAALGALVLGTSNKTELFLGYGTIHGDLASAINPIGDLYKTQVWALATAVGVPRRIVQKHPSADLWAGQTDEEELGFTYADVDELLHFMIERRYRHNELLALGFDPLFVARVEELVLRSQYKRRMPLIAKVSGRSITHDFRYPRDWKR
ncbi:MAG: NAD+ synthase [Candidatus Krumholzibacteriia bacterium]